MLKVHKINYASGFGTWMGEISAKDDILFQSLKFLWDKVKNNFHGMS
jgi:hypothetical protein